MPRTRSMLTIAAIAALLGGGASIEPPRRSAPMAYNRNGAFGATRKGGRRKGQGKRSGRGRR